MRYFVNYDKACYKLDVPPDKEVRWIKQLLRGKIGSNTGEKFVLHHRRIELQDDWMLSKLVYSIPPGSIIHCTICKNRLDIEVELNYSGKRHSIMEEFSRANTVHELKCEIQFRLGLPVSSFTLYFGSLKMYDNQKLDEFNINAPAIIALTSWKEWDKFLWCATEGRTKQLSGSMEKDQAVCKYQQRVALFIAAHHNFVDMASRLLQLDVPCSEPVGAHPSELWREPLRKSHPELTAPIFHAVAKGNLDILRLFLETKPDLLSNVDSQEHTLIDVALKHKHVKCVEYMRTVRLRNRSRGSTALRRYSYIFKLIVRLVQWRKIASLRLKPYKLSKRKIITMIANMCIMDDIHNDRLMRPERNNLQINKPECQEYLTDYQALTSVFTSCDSNTQAISYLHGSKNCSSNNVSPTGCELPAVLSLPSISSSLVFSGALSSTSAALMMASPLNENRDGLQNILPTIKSFMSPIDRSKSIPTIRVKKYDKFLFDKQQYNKVYGEKVLNNQSLYSLALRCMETANLSCQKKSWMQQLQMAVSLGKSNVTHPK